MILIDWVTHQLHTNMFSSGAVMATLTGYTLFLLRGLPQILKSIFIYFLAIELSIKNNTDIFEDVCRWVERENLLVNARRLQLYDYYPDTRNRGNISFSSGIHWFWYEGRPVIFNKSVLNQQTGMYKIPEEISLLFLFRRDKSIATTALHSILNKDDTLIDIKTYTSNWETATRRNPRSINSVVMDKSTKRDLLEDIDNFYSNKDWYLQRGILYKRGYLFHGLPGTGKSSLILAIASMYNKTIYTINLKTLTDNTIIDAFISIPSDSIILLEDIDAVSDVVFDRQHLKENTKSSVSLSTLLNVLDGLFSKENVVVIMTSNYPEKLDTALLRNGRVDKQIEFSYFNRGLAEDMFDVFHPNHNHERKMSFLDSITYPIACCELQERLLHL